MSVLQKALGWCNSTDWRGFEPQPQHKVNRENSGNKNNPSYAICEPIVGISAMIWKKMYEQGFLIVRDESEMPLELRWAGWTLPDLQLRDGEPPVGQQLLHHRQPTGSGNQQRYRLVSMPSAV